MRAFVYLRDDEGKDRIGGSTSTVTPNYKTYATMERYYLRKYLPPGSYNVYVYYDWSNCYRKADVDYSFVQKECK